MKLNRKQVRKLLESTLNEEYPPATFSYGSAQDIIIQTKNLVQQAWDTIEELEIEAEEYGDPDMEEITAEDLGELEDMIHSVLTRLEDMAQGFEETAAVDVADHAESPNR